MRLIKEKSHRFEGFKFLKHAERIRDALQIILCLFDGPKSEFPVENLSVFSVVGNQRLVEIACGSVLVVNSQVSFLHFGNLRNLFFRKRGRNKNTTPSIIIFYFI